jgi:hypothetical protein
MPSSYHTGGKQCSWQNERLAEGLNGFHRAEALKCFYTSEPGPVPAASSSYFSLKMKQRSIIREFLSRQGNAILRPLDGNMRNRILSAYGFIRTLKPSTKLLGPRYLRSRCQIEIDITYACNLRCINCNRSCRQAPGTEQMTLQQIQMFINESVEKKVKWEKISVIGGEPTLHHDLLEILSSLTKYKELFSPDACIQLFTNGYGDKVNRVLSRVPEDIVVLNSMKTGNVNEFVAFNRAPKDTFLSRITEFSNGCITSSNCGIGLTPYGYYCCPVAGGIDRVFGFDMGRKELPSPDDSMSDQLSIFCELCGYFYDRFDTITKDVISPVWKEAYAKYHNVKPSLSSYATGRAVLPGSSML